MHYFLLFTADCVICGLAMHDVNATCVSLRRMKEVWWVSKCRLKNSLCVCVCVYLMIFVLFCQKFVVCSMCNENVLRDVTKFLTARVQMKQISICIIINLIQASQSGESKSICKDVFKFCYVCYAINCACWYMHKPLAFLWWTISWSF